MIKEVKRGDLIMDRIGVNYLILDDSPVIHEEYGNPFYGNTRWITKKKIRLLILVLTNGRRSVEKTRFQIQTHQLLIRDGVLSEVHPREQESIFLTSVKKLIE